jgi:putative membrane protein
MLFWIANFLVLVVAGLHIYFMVLEMFLWTKPHGRETSGYTSEKAEDTAVLAANQGLYNGFLAAGLIWALIRDLVQADAGFTFHIKVFFLVCVIIAGVYGGKTVKPKIYKVQAAPAAIALVLVWVAWILR